MGHLKCGLGQIRVCCWVVHLVLEPVKQVGKMLGSHVAEGLVCVQEEDQHLDLLG